MNKENIQKIFKAYDVRGIYGSEFDEKIAEKTAEATATFLNAKKILVAMDARASSPSLKTAVIEGLLKQNIDIVDMGVATTPMFYWGVNHEKTDGGIMITASHNPPKYNGLKITGKGAAPIGENTGLLDIKNSVLSDEFESSEKLGKVTEKDLTQEYVDFLSLGISDLNLKIAADFSCGASSVIVERLAKKLNFEVLSLCKVGEAETHEGNPLKDENVEDLKEKLKNEKVDLGVAFDTDADRIFFFSKDGKRIDSPLIASLISEDHLKDNKNAKFVGSINISKIFKETAEKNGGEYIKSRVGHVFIKQAMRENDATFGAELSGHFYFKEFFYADSGIFTMIKVLDLIKRSGKSIEKLTEKYDKYFRSGEVNFKVSDKEKSMKDIEKLFPKGKSSYEDGVTIELADFWLNARASNTEPLLRLNIEANSKELLDEKLKSIEEILK